MNNSDSCYWLQVWWILSICCFRKNTWSFHEFSRLNRLSDFRHFYRISVCMDRDLSGVKSCLSLFYMIKNELFDSDLCNLNRWKTLSGPFLFVPRVRSSSLFVPWIPDQAIEPQYRLVKQNCLSSHSYCREPAVSVWLDLFEGFKLVNSHDSWLGLGPG